MKNPSNKLKLNNNNDDEGDMDISGISDNIFNETLEPIQRDLQSIIQELYPKGFPKSYTINEDGEIIKYIIKKGRYKEIKGRSLWENMENERVCNRTWQSMKEHFRKVIVPKISLYSQLFKLSIDEVENIELYSTKRQSIVGNVSKKILNEKKYKKFVIDE
ncbi:hypothetical protein BLA29_012398 [Euroglyphus maynei]|uniref:Telomeric repeat-binding factor 2-interacting protein 1 n=1 Tax=Euroglyphus maynei TaxID=6958 RepID=A0A1Y3BTA9_EURMA|nr:hypothetical protein BLA29_012398 [Euroglyphus maynei]